MLAVVVTIKLAVATVEEIMVVILVMMAFLNKHQINTAMAKLDLIKI